MSSRLTGEFRGWGSLVCSGFVRGLGFTGLFKVEDSLVCAGFVVHFCDEFRVGGYFPS